jgi:glutathione peroxidase
MCEAWLSDKGGYFARPRWNFYKYLIGKDGSLHDWFGSITSPNAGRFRRAVDEILKN